MMKADLCANGYDELRNVCGCQWDVLCASDADVGDGYNDDHFYYDHDDGHRVTRRADFDRSNRDQFRHSTQF